MKAIKTIVGCAVFMMTLTMTSGVANAQATQLPNIEQPKINQSIFVQNRSEVNFLNLELNDSPSEPKKPKAEKPKELPKPEPPAIVQHVVADNESLTSIATKYGTTWQRLFYKNLNIANENVIKVGDVIVIPAPDEVLQERVITLPPAPVTPVTTPQNGSNNYRLPAISYNSAGNGYAAGNCTWYAKSRRPDLPNNLGNADTWTARASAQGIPTGTTPRAGAIGQLGMHVVYVNSVNADGTFNLTEMNYRGLYSMNSRTVSPHGWSFIY